MGENVGMSADNSKNSDTYYCSTGQNNNNLNILFA